MIDFLRPFLSRIIGSFVAGFIVSLAAKGIDIDPETASAVTTASVGILLAAFTALYSVIHRVIDKKLNPGDAAAKSIVVNEKYEAEELDRLSTARRNS